MWFKIKFAFALHLGHLLLPYTWVITSPSLNNEYCIVLYTFVTVPTMTATSSCSSNLLVRDANQSSGMIYSTRTSTYSSNMDCRDWTFVLYLYYRIVSRLYDVRVYDGDSTSAPLIGRFSGSSLPAPITSSSTKLYVRFTSDGSSQYRGFAARYRGIFLRIEDE